MAFPSRQPVAAGVAQRELTVALWVLGGTGLHSFSDVCKRTGFGVDSVEW